VLLALTHELIARDAVRPRFRRRYTNGPTGENQDEASQFDCS
jgi:hypothetical protein